MQQLGHGAIKSPADERNWTLAAAGASTTYPDSAAIEMSTIKPRMQGKLGTCVSNSVEEGVAKLNGVNEELSWRFNACLCYAFAGTKQVGPDGKTHDFTMFYKPALDGGTYPRLAAKIASIWGLPRASFFPNDLTLSPEEFYDASKIPQEAYKDALNYKIDSYYDVPPTEEGIKQAITFASQNNAWVMILRRIGDSYWKDVHGNSSWRKDSLLPIRLPNTYTGGHHESLKKYETEQPSGRTVLEWLNHWSQNWCSTSGIENGTNPQDTDGGYGREYLDIWLQNVVEVTVVAKDLKPNPAFTYNFTKILRIGNQGADVVALQHALTIDGEFTYPKWTGYFGPITQTAVMAFQRKYQVASECEIVAANGQVGPKTLAKLNSIFNK